MSAIQRSKSPFPSDDGYELIPFAGMIPSEEIKVPKVIRIRLAVRRAFSIDIPAKKNQELLKRSISCSEIKKENKLIELVEDNMRPFSA